jgi:nucleotide-binding universal stress UspA family protein
MTSTLFGNMSKQGALSNSLGPGTAILRGFALERETLLLDALFAVAARSHFRHMVSRNPFNRCGCSDGYGGQNFKGAPDVTLDLGKRLELTVDQSRKPGIAMRWQLKAGPIAEGLAEAVDELEPDLLFLGAYGNDRLDRKVLGTTAESLLRTLPCPVVTIGPKTVKKNLDPTRAAKMLCPIDFPEDVHDRLCIIARFAKVLSADVELVHVVDVSHEHSRPHNAVGTQFEFDLLVGRFQREGVLAHSTLLYGPPEHVITEYAQAVNANYIMFGLHHDGHSSSYFRKSLVAKTIKEAPCAVFTFAQGAVQKGCE